MLKAPHQPTTAPPPYYFRGFALVSVIALVVLLALAAIGLLTLSSIELRSRASGDQNSIARENARLALMEALADLQKKAGHDTRITAPASAVAGNTNTSPVTGVWRSWEGSDHQANGVPIAPDYDSKLESGSTSGVTQPGTGRFLGWLTSDTQAQNPAHMPPNLTTGSVPLLSSGSLGPSALESDSVFIDPTPLQNGAYAWWIQGENTKAYLERPSESPGTTSEWTERLASYGRPSADHFGVDLKTGRTPDLFASHQTLDLLPSTTAGSSSTEPISQSHFHDLTHYSRGLLTNVATGGWKRDLSLMTEYYSTISDKSFFTISPGNELSYSGTQMIYHWAEQNNFTSENGKTFSAGASCSWDALADFALQ